MSKSKIEVLLDYNGVQISSPSDFKFDDRQVLASICDELSKTDLPVSLQHLIVRLSFSGRNEPSASDQALKVVSLKSYLWKGETL